MEVSIPYAVDYCGRRVGVGEKRQLWYSIISNKGRIKEHRMTRIQFGWTMPVGMPDKADRSKHLQVIDHGIAMAKARFDSAWFVDHFQFDDRDVLEGWTALAYEAALHPEMDFGNAVLCQSYRNPAHMAKMGATLQFMTGGRFILGLGAGWKEDEYKAYNYPFPPAGVRVDELDE